jgi:hypothetical protein
MHPLPFRIPGTDAEPQVTRRGTTAPGRDEVRSVTDDASPRTHPQYGTCGGCQQLKHVTADGVLREHNRFETTGTALAPLRCSGSGTRYQEHTGPDEVSA